MLSDIVKLSDFRHLLKALWSMATDPRLELRYQGLQALNIIFLSAIRLSSNLKVTDLVTTSKEKTISDASLKDDYVFIFDSNFANLSGSDDTS